MKRAAPDEIALRFADASTLLTAITSALVPVRIARSPARVLREPDGAVLVHARASLDDDERAALARAGIATEPIAARSVQAAQAPHAKDVTCWAEAIATRRVGEPTELREVTFVAPDEPTLLRLAGELLRLGCDRQEVCASGDRFLLRATAPPYYSVARALDRVDGLGAYAGHGGVLVELGFAHPLAAELRPAEGHALFIDGDGGFTLSPIASGFQEIHEHVVLELPPPEPALVARPITGTLRVPLRLVRAVRGRAPTLWVVRRDAEAQLDVLAHELPEEVTARLLFAIVTSREGETVALVKARPGVAEPPALALDATAMAPLLQLPNLFAPVDTAIDPPLRPDVARRLLAPDPDLLTWIAPRANGTLARSSLPESAFAPLSEWVEYVLDQDADALAPWVRGASFAFEEYEAIAEGPRDAPAEDRAHEDAPKTGRKAKTERTPNARKRAAGTPRATTARTPEVAVAVPTAPDATTTTATTASTGTIARRAQAPAELARSLSDVERRFLDLDAPADAPERRPLWIEMARLGGALGRHHDAGLCFTRALWDAPEPEAQALVAAWAATEAASTGTTGLATLDERLAEPNPARDRIRALAAMACAAGEALRPRAAAVSAFLDHRERDLDVRSLWLARLALARAAGGDPLGLTRAHDTILSRLHTGLSVERDVPSFLRFVGRRERGESTATIRLVHELDALHGRFSTTARARSAVEAPPALTRAYVDLTFAYGFARLGEVERARRLAADAPRALDLSDPVHGFLVRAYRARVDQAIEALAPETPLPAALAGELNQLERFLRYKVDRLRQASSILEPQERLDPMLAFHRGVVDPRGDDLMPLRGETDRTRLGAEVARLFDHARGSPPEDRARLFDGLMDFFPQLPESQAAPYLDAIVTGLDGIAPLRRAELLEEALMLAGHFGRAALVRRIVELLTPLFAELGAEHVGQAATAVATGQRVLRRVGLKAEVASLVDALGRAAVGTGTPMLLARLALAGASLALDERDRARPAIDEALAKLTSDAPMAERLQLARGVARAVGHAPQEVALAALAKLQTGLARVTDGFNTNSHFCLSVIAFVESLVLGYAAEDLALGDLGRQWLDDDEALIRRRIHRDLANETRGERRDG